ncbi:MAG: hypothetical protein ACREDR_27750, partial [Blastocatellia bacterium]
MASKIELKEGPARTSGPVTEGPSGLWTRIALALGLGAVGSALAVGVASFPLSSLLIRPRLKRLSQLKSPHLKSRIERSGL